MKKGMTSFKGKYQVLCMFLVTTLFVTESASAATNPQEKLVAAANTVKGVLTALIVVVGGIACAKIVVKYLPVIDDPNEKNVMYKSITTALLVTALGGALVWLVPWAYKLLA